MNSFSRKYFLIPILFLIFLFAVGLLYHFYGKKQSNQSAETGKSEANQNASGYPVHKNITVTIFWVGEKAGRANDYIANDQSAWDSAWARHFGGTDDPKNRNGFFPAGFTPQENPFYFALPYNDIRRGKRKAGAMEAVYWADPQKWSDTQSMLKNQWIAITKNGKTAYAQWEDVGPFGEDDAGYVFGSAAPESQQNKNAGLDVSPAVRDFLGLKGEDNVDWQFVAEKEVPDGPWKKIITTSQVTF